MRLGFYNATHTSFLRCQRMERGVQTLSAFVFLRTGGSNRKNHPIHRQAHRNRSMNLPGRAVRRGLADNTQISRPHEYGRNTVQGSDRQQIPYPYILDRLANFSASARQASSHLFLNPKLYPCRPCVGLYAYQFRWLRLQDRLASFESLSLALKKLSAAKNSCDPPEFTRMTIKLVRSCRPARAVGQPFQPLRQTILHFCKQHGLDGGRRSDCLAQTENEGIWRRGNRIRQVA